MTQGSSYVLGTSNDSTGITLQGTWGNGQSNPDQPVTFKFTRRIKPELLQNKYYIISHHGQVADLPFCLKQKTLLKFVRL